MKNRNPIAILLYFLLLINLNLFSQIINHPDKGNQEDWVTLQDYDNQIWVGYKETENITWVRTISILPHNIDKVSKMIEDKGNYDKIFDRVTSSKIIRDDVVHIRIDMPYLIADRDYIVRYNIEEGNTEISYKFESAKDIYIPEYSSSVRLPDAAGEWYIKRINDSFTEVTYTWNGFLGGDFPPFALTRAWKTQGNEMITWLEESLNDLYPN